MLFIGDGGLNLCRPFADVAGFVKAECLPRGFGAVAKAVPSFAQRIFAAAIKRAAAFGAIEHDNGFRLGKAAQIVEIAVLAEGKIGVVAAALLGRGKQHGQAVGADFLQKLCAAGDVGLHGGLFWNGWFESGLGRLKKHVKLSDGLFFSGAHFVCQP